MINTPLRKAKREIDSPDEVWAVLQTARVLYLAMSRDDQPYVVPVLYGVHNGCLYVHTGAKGLKMEVLNTNPKVSFSVTANIKLAPEPEACDWGLEYRSVVGFGRVSLVDDVPEKEAALNAIMEHYGGGGGHEFPDKMTCITSVLRVDILAMRGKHSPVPAS